MSSAASQASSGAHVYGRVLSEADDAADGLEEAAFLLTLLPVEAAMALAIGEGSELQAPLARVVIGGLTASTLVTLVLVPAVYTLFEEGLSGLRRGPAQSHPERA